MKTDDIKKTILFNPLIRALPDSFYLKLHFRISVGYGLDLKNPRSFNEKMQYLKLYDRRSEYMSYVDKIEAKKYLASMIPTEYLIPTIGIFERFEDIDFSKLPHSFVIKTSHDSGGVVVCNNKNELDIKHTKRVITKSLKRNYFYLGREWPYKDIKPRILIERNISDSSPIVDYKLLSFNGRVKCLFTCTDRGSSKGLKVTFFDREWKRLPFTRHYPADENEIFSPVNLEKMIEISELITAKIPFGRIDFYEVNGHLFIGEITLYPGSGFEEFRPREWDYILGDMLDISHIRGK